MKNLKLKTLARNIVLGGFSVMVMTGCNDFLEMTPPSDLSPETFLTDESHLRAYTIRRYQDIIRTVDGTGGDGLSLDDAATDIVSNTSANSRYIPGRWTVGSGNGNWDFGNIYQINFFINTVIPRYEAGEISGNTNNITHYIGESYVLRAWNYFDKLVEYGDFPIVTHNISDDRDSLILASIRYPRNEVARFILEDLDRAIDMLLVSPPDGKVRISKYTAYQLKSRVALFEATWLKNFKGTAFVPGGTNWPGAVNWPNYSYPAGNIDAEIDFFLGEAMAAAKVVADAVSLEENTGLRRDVSGNGQNNYVEMFNSKNLEGYNEILLWREMSVTAGIIQYWNHYLWYGNGYGFTRQFVDTFLDEDGYPIYASSKYQGDDYITDVKANRDNRLQLFMKGPGELKSYIGTVEYEEDVPLIYNTGRYNEGTGYGFRKGLSYDYGMTNPIGQDETGIVVMRAAESYLNYIEACYERYGYLDADADKYWKALRTRAKVDPDYTVTINATNMTLEGPNNWAAYTGGQLVDATLYNIRRERGNELFLEGHRWRDLRRWRALDQLNDFQIEGFKLWGPIHDLYPDVTVLVFQAADNNYYYVQTSANLNAWTPSVSTEATVSSPENSLYLRMHQITRANLYYNGYNWTEAHYLSPIGTNTILDASPDYVIANSVVTQNPGWPTVAGQGPSTVF